MIIKRIELHVKPGHMAEYLRAQEIWNREMPAIPIVSQDVLAGWKTRVGNLRPSILRPHLIWNAEELTVGDR